MSILILALIAQVEQVHTGLRFTEGPAADAAGIVHFNDIPHQKLYRVEKDGKLVLVREKTNRANGLFFHGKGELYACEGGAGAVVAYGKDGSRRVIADKFAGKRFNAPNDLVIDKAGGVYFTDPFFGRRTAELPQGVFGVYYVTPQGAVTRLYANEKKPNGIILSPDEKTLYVVCSGQAMVVSLPVEAPGKVGKPGDFFALKQPEGRDNTGGDGLSVGQQGQPLHHVVAGHPGREPGGEAVAGAGVPGEAGQLHAGRQRVVGDGAQLDLQAQGRGQGARVSRGSVALFDGSAPSRGA